MIHEWFGFTLDIPYREAIIFVLATFIYLYGGKPGMMTLISMAISVAYFYSVMTLVMPSGKEFFWELATLIDIMLIGHYIEAKSVLGAADALEELVKMMPKTALNSEHIIAKAIVNHAESKGVEPLKATDFTAYPGIGAKVAVGRPQILLKEALTLTDELKK